MMNENAPFRQEHFDVLLAQMIRSPTIRDLAIETLEPRFFTVPVIGGTPVQGILFMIIKNYTKEHGVAPDEAVIAVEVDIYLKKYFSSDDAKMKVVEGVHRFIEIARRVTDRSEPLARKVLQYIADVCVHKVAVDDAIREYNETGVISSLRENLILVESKQSVLHGGLASNNIFEFAGDEDTGTRVSTHVPWLDARFGKGAGPSLGSVLSIIAPQGHGKTSLGIQLGVAQALVGRYAMLVLAEEGLSPQIKAKIAGCALGIDWTKIEQAPPKTFTEKINYAVKEARVDPEVAAKKMAHISEYLHVLDLVKRGAVADALELIDGELNLLRSKQKAPTYVYVDWAGIICDAIANRTGKQKREELQTFSYKLSEFSQRHNNIIAVSHQMAPSEALKGAFARHDQYCGAECRSFTEPHKYVFVLNPRDAITSYQLLQVPKSRNDEPPEPAVMQLRGDLSCFYDMSKQYRLQGKRFVKNRDVGNEGKLPVER